MKAKVLSCVLVASIVINGVLCVQVFILWKQGSSALDVGTQPDRAEPKQLPLSAVDPKAPFSLSNVEAINMWSEADHQSLRDQLLKAGIPRDDVIAIIDGRLRRPYRERMKRLLSEDVAAANYWKGRAAIPSQKIADELMMAEKQAREARLKLRELFGSETILDVDKRSLELSFLPGEKRHRLSELEQDYHEMRKLLTASTGGFVTESDRRQLEYLEAQRRADMSELLTPKELEDYDNRFSTSAEKIRGRFALLDLTEAEYLKLLAVQRVADNAARNSGTANAGERTLIENYKSVLGEDRFAEWQAASGVESQLLAAAANRYNLDAKTVVAAKAIGPEVISNAEAIANDKALSRQDKIDALMKLSSAARARLAATLGNDIAETYLKNGALPWLGNLDRGVGVGVVNGRVVHRLLD